MINQALFSSKKEDWETPDDLFNELNKEFKFQIDVCADATNAKCKKYMDKYADCLTYDWHFSITENGYTKSQFRPKSITAWMNPPYGKKIEQFIQKASMQTVKGVTTVCLLPARTDTKWFHNLIYKHEGVEIRFLKGRLKFKGAKHSAPFPSMIVIFKGAIDANRTTKKS